MRDFGIRSYDLAYEIAAGYEAVILVDAVPRGEEPGTIFLIEPDASELGELPPVAVNAHALSPMRALQMARSLNQELGRIYLVGCEPAVLMTDDGLMGLSKPVHVLQRGEEVNDIVNMAAIAVVDAQERA